MPSPNKEVVLIIGAVIFVLIFLGVMITFLTVYHSNRRRQLIREKQVMREEFDKQLLQAQIEMQEQTFTFISGEIHDNVGQVLSSAKVQLSILEEGQVFDKSLIKQIKESVGKAISELRDMSRSLDSDRIQTFNLLQSIEEEIFRINKSGMAEASVSIGTNVENLRQEKKLLLFRVVQESLQNMIKHSKATFIQISINALSGTRLQIQIKDNGVGFNVADTFKNAGGLGLKNMKKRIELISGTLEINSEINVGTTVIITLDNE